MKKNKKIFNQVSAIALASTLLVSSFPRIQLTQAATTFSITSKVTIGKGESFQLNTKGTSSKISFQSSNKKVVSVTQSGKIKGKKVGKATITAKLNKKTKKCKVTVKNAPKKISFSQKEITLLPGATKKLAISFSSGYSNKIAYKSENSTVASVSVNGIVTAKNAGETIITAKTFNGKTAAIRCIVADNSTPDATNATVSTTSPAITGTPQQTEGTATNTPLISNTPVSSLNPTPTGNTLRPIPTKTPNTEESLKPTTTPESSKIPSSEVPSTENPTAVPTTQVSTTPSSTVTATSTPSLEPTATTQTTVTSSAVISKIEDGTIYIDNDKTELQLTSCITYHKACFDGTLYTITKEELLPGDTIEITSSGLISSTYPVSTLADCDQIVVTDSIANAIMEDKISTIDEHTLEITNHKNAKFYFDASTKIYKRGQEITKEQLKEDDVIRVCAYDPTIKGKADTISMDFYIGYARTIVVLGDSVKDLQKEQVDLLYSRDCSDTESIWVTSLGNYLVTNDTLFEITQSDGSITYKTNQLLPVSTYYMTIYYETLPNEYFDTTKKAVRISYTTENQNYDTPDDDIIAPKKPVIYLYPEEKTDVTVDLDFDGELTYTYPYTENGRWQVTADTDGTLTNKADGLEYSYLFWEGATDKFTADFSKGFCVKGEDTTKFLQTILPKMGLTPKEYNEFIVYWAPQMQDNAYNLISFQNENYEQNAPLHINPAPDSMLRVYMAYKPLTSPVDIEPQTFEPFEREGFTVVEWGGCVVSN